MSIRPRHALSIAVTILGVAAALVAVVLGYQLALDHPKSIDLTHAGQHRLADRTQRQLESLGNTGGEFELILTVNSATVPNAGAFLGVIDLLTAIADQSANLNFSLLDLADVNAADASAEIVGRLAERAPAAHSDRFNLIESATGSFEQGAAFLRTLADELDGVRDAIPLGSPSAETNRGYFEQRSALLRVAATDLDRVIETVLAELANPTGPQARVDGVTGPLVNTDRFLEPLASSATAIDDQLAALSRDVEAFAEAPAMVEAARNVARNIPDLITRERDRLARTADTLNRAEPLEALRVGTVLQTGEILLVVGPPGLGTAAVPINALFVETGVVESVGLSSATWSARRAEELVVSALGSLVNPAPPIVVLTHGESNVGLLESPALRGLGLRLSQRGVDLAEWAAARDAEPPLFRELDPDGTRPRVYVTINPDSTGGSTGQPDQAGSQRTLRFARALQGVLDAGEPVLLSANPSLFPTYGDADPLNALIEPFGITLASGTPILSEFTNDAGRGLLTEQRLAGDLEDHPIADAIRGLALEFPWPIPVRVTGDAEPLLGSALPNSWAEGEWVNYWQTPRQGRAALQSTPQPGGRRDLTADRWTLAASASRPNLETGRAQRLVVVGSNGWFLDPIALQQTEINQQSVLTVPGNIELLEAAVFWLAGQDDLIARSTTAAQVATVRPLDPSQQGVLRWTLLLGLPASVLAIGVVSRLIFG